MTDKQRDYCSWIATGVDVNGNPMLKTATPMPNEILALKRLAMVSWLQGVQSWSKKSND